MEFFPSGYSANLSSLFLASFCRPTLLDYMSMGPLSHIALTLAGGLSAKRLFTTVIDRSLGQLPEVAALVPK